MIASLLTNARAHDDAMNAAFASVASEFKDVLIVDPYVTTMTVGFRTSFRAANLQQLQESVTAIKNVKETKPFRNCVFLKMDRETYGSNMMIKVFINGSMQITGCKTAVMAVDAMHMMVQALTVFFGDDVQVIWQLPFDCLLSFDCF